jgi:D-3-phosphoglycerate dehydrogenase
MIMLAKHLQIEANHVKQGNWKRITGRELAGKTLGILGLGRIGKEVARRARGFDMRVTAYDIYWDEPFAYQYCVNRADNAEQVLETADVITLHMNLGDDNRRFINRQRIARMRQGALVINCSRGGLVDEQDVAEACTQGRLGGYAADVLEHEPMATPHPFQDVDNIIITPHIASRTFESVERQALMATENLLRVLAGEKPLAQANAW